jgi:hypothetical protein
LQTEKQLKRCKFNSLHRFFLLCYSQKKSGYLEQSEKALKRPTRFIQQKQKESTAVLFLF